jgi:hypothetical protein
MGDPVQAPAFIGPVVQPLHSVQPYDVPQASQSRLEGVPVQEPGVSHPTQPPQPTLVPHREQLAYTGVPEHVGPVLKMCGGSAGDASAVAQQMRSAPVQSLSE